MDRDSQITYRNSDIAKLCLKVSIIFFIIQKPKSDKILFDLARDSELWIKMKLSVKEAGGRNLCMYIWKKELQTAIAETSFGILYWDG